MEYDDYYIKGLEFFDRDVEDVVERLESNECVALCSLPGMGDARFCGYLAYKLSVSKKFKIFYDKSDSLFEQDLSETVEKTPRRKVVFIVPYMSERPRAFQENFARFIKRNDSRCLSVMVLGCKIFASKASYFRSSGSVITYIKSRAPLDFDMTCKYIEVRGSISRWKPIPLSVRREMFQLSGGIMSLIKHICAFYNQTGDIILDKILSHPAILRELERLKEVYTVADSKHFEEIGIVDSEGRIVGELFRRFVEVSDLGEGIPLSPKLLRLFNLFLERKNSIVPMSLIDEHLRESGDFSLWGNYKLVSRLKRAVSRRYVISNVKGQGYVLRDRR